MYVQIIPKLEYVQIQFNLLPVTPFAPLASLLCTRFFLYSYGNVCLVASSQGPNVTTQQYFALVARSNLLSPAWRRVFAHPVHARSKFLLFCAQMMFVIFACSSFACAKPVPGFLYNIYFSVLFFIKDLKVGIEVNDADKDDLREMLIIDPTRRLFATRRRRREFCSNRCAQGGFFSPK